MTRHLRIKQLSYVAASARKSPGFLGSQAIQMARITPSTLAFGRAFFGSTSFGGIYSLDINCIGLAVVGLTLIGLTVIRLNKVGLNIVSDDLPGIVG